MDSKGRKINWFEFKTIIMKLQEKYVPHVRKYGTTKERDLANEDRAVKLTRKRHRVYRKYKDNRNPVCEEAEMPLTDVQKEKKTGRIY